MNALFHMSYMEVQGSCNHAITMAIHQIQAASWPGCIWVISQNSYALVMTTIGASLITNTMAQYSYYIAIVSYTSNSCKYYSSGLVITSVGPQ